MDIAFYKTKANNKEVNKNIEHIVTLNCRLKEPTNIQEPIFIVEKFDECTRVNYIYCHYLRRYYFIKKTIIGQGGQIEYHCKSDVLMSFNSFFLGKEMYIDRQEKVFQNSSEGLFPDATYPIRVERTIRKRKIGTVSNSHGYYITVNGGI